MNMTSLTPSTGERRPVAFDLNRLKLQPGERVVYWSHAAQAPTIETIDGYASDDGNFFVIADFAAVRGQPTYRERADICDRHGLNQ